MEHFSRLLPLKDSGQEFTRSNQVNVSSGSNVVPQREGGERDVGTEPRNALGGAARVLLRHWAALLSGQNGRALGIRDSATSGLRPRVPGTRFVVRASVFRRYFSTKSRREF